MGGAPRGPPGIPATLRRVSGVSLAHKVCRSQGHVKRRGRRFRKSALANRLIFRGLWRKKILGALGPRGCDFSGFPAGKKPKVREEPLFRRLHRSGWFSSPAFFDFNRDERVGRPKGRGRPCPGGGAGGPRRVSGRASCLSSSFSGVSMTPRVVVVSSLLLAAGLALGGWFAGQGVLRARTAERFVTVKGLAERPARAELALWPLRLSVSDSDLARGHAKMAADVRHIQQFLLRHGIDTAGIALQDFVVNDAYSNQYQTERVASRYVIRQTVMVRSTQPEKVLAASQRIGELVEAGVVFTSGN